MLSNPSEISGIKKDSIHDAIKMFLDFLGLRGTLEEQAEEFLMNAKQNPEWVQNNLIHFISYQNDRAKRGEI
jgi:hypothetical protein